MQLDKRISIFEAGKMNPHHIYYAQLKYLVNQQNISKSQTWKIKQRFSYPVFQQDKMRWDQIIIGSNR